MSTGRLIWVFLISGSYSVSNICWVFLVCFCSFCGVHEQWLQTSSTEIRSYPCCIRHHSVSPLSFLSYLPRQMVAGKMLRLLHQWHRPQKDPGAFIQILPTESIHLYSSSTQTKHTKINLSIHELTLVFTVLKEFTVAHFGALLWNPEQEKKISACNIGHLGYKQKVSQQKSNNTAINGNVCTDFTLYTEGWGYLFTHNVFTQYDEMI